MSYLNPVYSPYGAFELKARYFSNLLKANLIVLSLVIIIVSVYYLSIYLSPPEIVIPIKPEIFVPVDIPNPPIIVRDKGSFGPTLPNHEKKGTIPVPVKESEWDPDQIEEELYTRDELYYLGEEGIESGGKIGYGEDDFNFIGDDPPADSFIIVDKMPELVYDPPIKYPPLAQKIGLTGTVWVQALVDIDSRVKKAQIGKSSEIDIFDEVAVKAAYDYIYSPAVRNDRPVKVGIRIKLMRNSIPVMNFII